MSTSSSSRSSRRVAVIAIQSLLGAFVIGIWALVSNLVSDDEVLRVVMASLPYFVVYELGVLSRYVPGVRSIAKRLE